MNIFQQLKERLFPDIRPLSAGTHHFQSPDDSPYRLHLRLEPDGSGLLIINASTILHLNQTASEYAYHLVKQTPVDEVARTISRRYNVKIEQAEKDYSDLRERIETLITTPDLDPVTFLDFERTDVYTNLSAPLRLICALTYRLEDDPNAAPRDRVKRELLGSEWKTILAKAWEAGIPHAIFTGGEPTLRPDLVDLIACTQELGMVSGLLSNGLRLSEKPLLTEILNAGLDHLMFLLEAGEDQSWEALRDVLAADLFTTVHLTITKKNKGKVSSILDKLAKMGVVSISLSAEEEKLKPELDAARQNCADLHVQLAWDLPVPYSHFNPVQMELAAEGTVPNAGGNASLYVEPDGDVLPAQGINRVIGNLLTDDWQQIWNNLKGK